MGASVATCDAPGAGVSVGDKVTVGSLVAFDLSGIAPRKIAIAMTDTKTTVSINQREELFPLVICHTPC